MIFSPKALYTTAKPLAIDDIIGKNEELIRLTEELTEIYKDQTLEMERLFDLRMLAAKGPFTKEERLREEKKINEAHKERIIFLEQEEKFGTKIAESLARQRRELQGLSNKVTIELALATKLSPIDLDPTIKVMFDRFGKIAIDSLDKTIAIAAKNEEEFKKSRDAYDEWLTGIANDWKEHFKSMAEIADEEIDKVKLAVEGGLLTVAEGERAIAQIRADYYSAQVDQWSGFVVEIGGMLSELGGSFGRFMSQIVSAAQSIQGVNQTAQSLGGWSTAMGAWGGTIAAFVELYKFADSVIQKHKGEKFGTRGSISITGGLEVPSYINQAGMELTRAISEVLRSFEDSLRISVEDLAAIEIRVRNNGKDVQAWVEGVWVGTFQDVNTAIRQALVKALSDPSSGLSGLSDLMIEGISSWTSPNMEGLADFLGQLRTISDLSLSPAVISLQEAMIEFNRLREALSKLDQSSQAVIDAQNDLTEAQNRLYNQTKAGLLGIDLSASEGIRALLGFQKGMDAVSDSARRGLEEALLVAQRRLDNLTKTAAGTPPQGSGGGVGVGPGVITLSGEINEEISNLKTAIEGYKAQLAEIPKALTDQEIDLGIYTQFADDMKRSGRYAKEITEFEQMRVTIRYNEIKLSLIALGAWERWADVWQDLYNQAMKDAGTLGRGIGRGGGIGSGKDSVRDFIRDKKFELSLVGLTDYQKSLAELDKQYDDLIRQAGNDKKLKAELLALKEKELKLLADEKRLRTVEKFQDFMGKDSQFDRIRKTSQGLIDDIKNSPFGDARKANMINRVLAETERQLEAMSKEVALGLFGSMLSDMEKFGASEEQMHDARVMMAELEHQMKLASFALTIAELEAENKLTDEQMAKFHEMFDFLAGINPADFIGGSGGSPPSEVGDNFSSYSSTSVFEEFEDRLKSVQDKLAEWNRIPLSESLSKAHEMTDSFDQLMVDVQKLIPMGWNYTQMAIDSFRGLVSDFVNDNLAEFEERGSDLEITLRGIGDRFRDINDAFVHLQVGQEDLQRAELARLNAVDKALAQYLDPIRERRLSREVGERSILTGEQQYLAAQRQFRELFSQIRQGNLENLDNVVSLAGQYEDLVHSFTGGEGLRFGLKEIDDTLLAIENLVPEFAQEMAEIGTEGNPMVVNNTDMVNAIQDNMEAVNTGNSLVLAEMRNGLDQMKEQSIRLKNIDTTLSNSNNLVKMIA